MRSPLSADADLLTSTRARLRNEPWRDRHAAKRQDVIAARHWEGRQRAA
jgi:hypothetical protein